MSKTFHKKLLSESSQTAMKIAVIYIFMGAIWYFTIERIGDKYYSHYEYHSYIELMSSTVFLFISAAVLFVLIKKSLKSYAEVADEFETQRDLYNLITANTNDVIWLLSIPENKFKFVSPSVQRLRGFSPEEVIEKPFADSLTKKSYQQISKILVNLTKDYENGNESARTHTVEVDQQCKDGSIINTEVVITLLKNRDGKVSEVLGVSRDITERKLTEKALVSSEKKYRTIIETTMNGFFISNTDGTFLEVNDSLCQLTGYTRSELFQMKINDLDFLETTQNIKEHAEQIMKFGPQKFESKLLAKNGTVLSIETSVAYSPDGGGIFYGFINNVTEKNKMLMEVLKARDEAERSTQLKSEFLAQMSHEIRSPLNVTLSFTNFIKDEMKSKLTPVLEESFFAIDTSIKRVIRTIDLILNMSEMQLGTYEPTWKNFDLVEEVFNVIQREYEFTARRKGLDLIIQSKLKTAKVYGDQYSVTQIFVNLIDNAIKYTNSGQIEITIDRDKQRNVVVTVKDSGIGISEEYIPKLFVPFTQEEQGYSRRFEGNGLGLALVKRYCDLNNSTISVESKKGFGTTFIITFRRLSKLNVQVN